MKRYKIKPLEWVKEHRSRTTAKSCDGWFHAFGHSNVVDLFFEYFGGVGCTMLNRGITMADATKIADKLHREKVMKLLEVIE